MFAFALLCNSRRKASDLDHLPTLENPRLQMGMSTEVDSTARTGEPVSAQRFNRFQLRGQEAPPPTKKVHFSGHHTYSRANSIPRRAYSPAAVPTPAPLRPGWMGSMRERSSYTSSMNTSGCCSAIRNKASAGPLGLRRPCSQSWTVRKLTPIRPAKAACDSCNLARMS